MRTVFCTCRPKIWAPAISITGSSGLSKDEVEKMQREAEAHAEEDKKAKEAIEIKNNADMLAYQSEKQLKELGDKISGDKKKQVEDAIAAVRDAINRNDVDAMKRTYDDLQNKFQEISAELYKQASTQAGPRPGPQPGPEAQPGGGAEEGTGKRDGGDVVDAEFEVVDENKKK
jgi:molecular chaperone DnaK